MSRNEITGDNIITDAPTEKFSSGWDAIWGNKKAKESTKPEIPIWFPEWASTNRTISDNG